MIRRISKNNDLRDIIKSCPSGVIDDIFDIKYYIQGHNTYIDATFEKVGSQLVVVLPTTLLSTLPNGILMRKASYKVVDESYPDGYYNLEFEDNLNIWLGEDESETPEIPEYVTETELSSTLSSYVQSTQMSLYLSTYASIGYVQNQDLAAINNVKRWVSSQSYITSAALSGYATESWVSSQGFLTSVPDYFATQSWVLSQGYITSETIPSDIATQSWVSTNFLSSTALNGYATQSWVSNQGYLTSETIPSDIATQSWVQNQGYITSESLPSGIATQSWVSSNFLSATALTGYATESWVSSNFLSTTALSGYLKSESGVVQFENEIKFLMSLGSSICGIYIGNGGVEEGLAGVYTKDSLGEYVYNKFILLEDVINYTSGALTGYATQSWVSTNFLSSTALTGYATQSWVSTNFLSSTALTGYATQSWVSTNFLSSTALTGYATEAWVSAQGYLTTIPNTYATKSWVSSNFFEESQVWVGTQEQWARLTSEEKASYKIALVTA